MLAIPKNKGVNFNPVVGGRFPHCNSILFCTVRRESFQGLLEVKCYYSDLKITTRIKLPGRKPLFTHFPIGNIKPLCIIATPSMLDIGNH